MRFENHSINVPVVYFICGCKFTVFSIKVFRLMQERGWYTKEWDEAFCPLCECIAGKTTVANQVIETWKLQKFLDLVLDLKNNLLPTLCDKGINLSEVQAFYGNLVFFDYVSPLLRHNKIDDEMTSYVLEYLVE